MQHYLKSFKHFVIMGLISSPIIFLYIWLFSLVTELGLLKSLLMLGPATYVLLLILLSSWFLCVATPLHISNISNLLIRHIGAIIVISVVWIFSIFIYTNLLSTVYPELSFSQNMQKTVPFFIATVVVFYFLLNTVHYLIIAFEKSKKAEEAALKNSLLARESQLSSLKSTIHPHFLFNSLTALGALTVSEPDKARKLAERISAFLRYSLRYYQKNQVTISEELEHLKNYIEIEKQRLGDRLKVNCQIFKPEKNLVMLPMVLMPLVENAIKHGISQLVEGGTIDIRFYPANDKVVCEVSNPFDPVSRVASGENKGLETLRNRLAVAYGEEAGLRVQQENKIFTVRIIFPVKYG